MKEENMETEEGDLLGESSDVFFFSTGESVPQWARHQTH